VNSKIDKLIEHDIDTLNDHLPRARIRLTHLLKEENPHFMTRSGEKSVFKDEELEWLNDEIPKRFHNSIRLPIVLLHKILGYDDLVWENFAIWKPVEHLSRPQVQIIRQKMPSTTSLGIVFTTSRDSKRSDSLKS